MPRHEVIASACPPTSGANTGATPVTAISSANTRAAASPRIQVADDRARDHHAGAAERPLDEPQHDQHPDRRCDRARQRRRDVADEPGQQRPPPSERVAERTGEELAGGDPEHAPGERQLPGRRRRAEVMRERRQAR